MKKLCLFIVVSFISYCSFCQTLTGLWNGTFSNDSTTLRTDQPFELALTEYRGKIYGYSRREFIKNDTLYFVLKRVKGKIDGDICDVTEDEFVSHNLPTIDKGVKITYTFHFNKNDSTWSLDGKWKTNRVVKRRYEYYALTGNVGMSMEKDLSKSKLFPHLTELKLDDDVPFYASYKKQIKIEEEQRNIAMSRKLSESRKADIAKTEPKKTEEKTIVKTAITENPPAKEIAKKGDSEKSNVQTQTKTATVADNTQKDIARPKQDSGEKNNNTAQKNQVAAVTADPTVSKPKADTSTVIQKELTKTEREPEQKKRDDVKKDVVTVSNSVADRSKEIPEVTAKPVAAANVEKRISETIQAIEFKSDSITLALYDNGEIDGDTVSVLINGEVIMSRQGLKASAIKKTVYITPAMQDSFTLVLYAENLGLYPPNTGLIIVRDGDDSYQVRFSADLQKNVAVLFKRKKK